MKTPLVLAACILILGGTLFLIAGALEDSAPLTASGGVIVGIAFGWLMVWRAVTAAVVAAAREIEAQVNEALRDRG